MPAPAAAAVPHLGNRASAIEALGWDRRDAEWIALVCLHSGAFVRAQFCGRYALQRVYALRLVRRLTERGVAREHPLPGSRQRFCHILAKPLYRALGIANVRHRRLVSGAILFRRLLSLDVVLDRPGLPWLPTEQDKVAYFESLGIDPGILPKRTYRPRRGRGRGTIRHFALKLPIAGDRDAAHFVHTDPGHETASALHTWGRKHRRLWEALRAAGVSVHVLAVSRSLDAEERAEPVLASWLAPSSGDPLSPDEAELLDRIQAALLARDHAALRAWGGFSNAVRVAGPLRRRARAQRRAGAGIDGYQTLVSRRLADDPLLG